MTTVDSEETEVPSGGSYNVAENHVRSTAEMLSGPGVEPAEVLEAFKLAVDNKLEVPDVLLRYIAHLFGEYLAAEGRLSLDELFLLRATGKGREKSAARLAREKRNQDRVSEMSWLRSILGVTVPEAAHMVARRLETEGKAVSSDSLQDTYYAERRERGNLRDDYLDENVLKVETISKYPDDSIPLRLK